MCGREPNFELSEEDKKELRKLTWEEFLALTRTAISSKSKLRFSASNLCEVTKLWFLLFTFPPLKFAEQQRRTEFSSRRKLEPADKSYWEAGQGGISGSEG